MKRAVLLSVAILMVLTAVASAEPTRVYDTNINTVWDHAVKAIRDVNFALVDSDRPKHEFTMRNRAKTSHKKGILMDVELTRAGDATTTLKIRVVDPRKVERAQKHIAAYLAALDRRLD